MAEVSDYDTQQGMPAIRNASREHPARCPWCGNDTWFPSDWDDARDHGRVQMYCDTPECASRETDLIIMRGESAHDRADVRALNAIDDGAHTGDEPPPTEFTLGDTEAHEALDRVADRRIDYRTYGDPFTLDVN